MSEAETENRIIQIIERSRYEADSILINFRQAAKDIIKEFIEVQERLFEQREEELKLVA